MLPSARLMPTGAARQVLVDAIASRVFPAAAVDVGGSAGPMWQDAVGTLTFDDTSPASGPGAAEAVRTDRTVGVDTPFDLASLTKVVATTTVVMQLVHSGKLRLDERVSRSFGEWRGRPRDEVTVRDLLEHASGLAARLVDQPPSGRREFEHEICEMPLEYEPRARSVYSDLGFILLGFLASDRGGRTLDEQMAAVFAPLEPSIRSITFTVPPPSRHLAAPTLPSPDDARRGRALAGEVHDTYAAALGGVAGHAGLFGAASAVGAFARTVLRAARGDGSIGPPFLPALVRQFVQRSAVPGSSRALGWDTMLATSSCGTRMSPSAFGHVGFTGTSMWIDPDRDRYFVLLSNRACGGGSLETMRDVRRAFHDALGEL